MKALIHKTAIAAATIAATVATAFAAPENAEPTGLVGWVFLGFCALIAVAQIMPALMMIVGAAMGLRKEGREVRTHN